MLDLKFEYQLVNAGSHLLQVSYQDACIVLSR